MQFGVPQCMAVHSSWVRRPKTGFGAAGRGLRGGGPMRLEAVQPLLGGERFGPKAPRRLR